MTPVNFTSGVVRGSDGGAEEGGRGSSSGSYWLSNDNTPAMAKDPRRELTLEDPDSPDR